MIPAMISALRISEKMQGLRTNIQVNFLSYKSRCTLQGIVATIQLFKTMALCLTWICSGLRTWPQASENLDTCQGEQHQPRSLSSAVKHTLKEVVMIDSRTCPPQQASPDPLQVSDHGLKQMISNSVSYRAGVSHLLGLLWSALTL